MQNRTTDSSFADDVRRTIAEMPSEQRLTVLQKLRDLTCSECGSINFREIDGETVCTGCGTVRDNSRVRALENPTSDYELTSHGKPITHLAFGKGLGGTLQKKDLFRVLEKARAGKVDIGLRVRQMSIFQSSNDHPTIHSMLEIGSDLCEEFGMTGEDAVFFADYLGKTLRKVSESAVRQKGRGESIAIRRLTVATFVYVWQLMERDRGLREKIEYQPFFPGNRKVFKTVANKYKVDKKAWDFVHFEVNRNALWMVHQARLKSGRKLMATVNSLRPNDEIVQSSAFLIDGHDVSEDTFHGRLSARKKRARKPKYPGAGEIPWEKLTEHQRELLKVFEEEDGKTLVSESTVETNVCSFVARKSLGGGILATVLNVIQGLEQSTRSTEVAEEQVRTFVDRLALPGKSAKKRRQKSYDMYAFLVSALAIKTGLTPDLFIRSVVLRRLLEAYSDPARLKGMPWGTRRRYGIVTRTLERLPLILKSS
jgi:hypothetical protein